MTGPRWPQPSPSTTPASAPARSGGTARSAGCAKTATASGTATSSASHRPTRSASTSSSATTASAPSSSRTPSSSWPASPPTASSSTATEAPASPPPSRRSSTSTPGAACASSRSPETTSATSPGSSSSSATAGAVHPLRRRPLVRRGRARLPRTQGRPRRERRGPAQQRRPLRHLQPPPPRPGALDRPRVDPLGRGPRPGHHAGEALALRSLRHSGRLPLADQRRYLAVVESLASQRGLTLDPEVLRRRRQWAEWHNGRSGRTAPSSSITWKASWGWPARAALTARGYGRS